MKSSLGLIYGVSEHRCTQLQHLSAIPPHLLSLISPPPLHVYPSRPFSPRSQPPSSLLLPSPLQVNQPKFNQRRISSAKFLGELYNYRMVESAVIFRTLFSFISFGVNPDGGPSALDPPEHLFRIRMVCTLLDTCGQYFDRGSSKRKLDCFLIYFQVSRLDCLTSPYFTPLSLCLSLSYSFFPLRSILILL